MALTLLEASKLTTEPLKKGIIEIFPRSSAVLERLPFFNVDGMAYRYNLEDTLPGIGFRGINQSYDESTGIINPQVESLFIGGGLSNVDRALIKTQGKGNDIRAIHDAMKAKAFALDYTRMFFKGNNATNHNTFDGLERRLTGTQLLDMGSSEGGDTLTLDRLDELIDAVIGSPDVLFMNKTMRRKVNKLMRAAGQANETVTDSFGKQIYAYAGIPIGVIEEDKDGVEILGFVEPDTGTTATTSIYAVKFGAGEYVSGLQNGDMVVEDKGNPAGSVFYITDIEWICGMGIFHPKAAARLRGIKNA
ncbi:MAG: major capsid protein [Desulfobacteraceae bacterium]|jgi:hypothetical protein